MMNIPDLRTKRCFDGLYYSFELLKYHYTELFKQYPSLSSNPLLIGSQIIPLLSNIWPIVDHVFRIREISRVIPGPKDKRKSEFLKKTSPVEVLRHYYQHLQRELKKNEIDTLPVLGSISWVDPVNPQYYYTAYYGNVYTNGVIAKMSCYGGEFNIDKRKWSSRICLAIKNARIDIDPIYESAIEFEKHIMNRIKISYLGNLQEPSTVYLLTAEMDINKGLIFNGTRDTGEIET